MRALAVLWLALCATCVTQTRIVTVVEPYVPELSLDSNEARLHGKVDCDRNNKPVVYIHPRLSEYAATFVRAHESVHLEQVRRYPGGCVAMMERYRHDSVFVLNVESAAFCAVVVLQRSYGVTVDPTVEEVIGILRYRYGSAWGDSTVRAAVYCRT